MARQLNKKLVGTLTVLGFVVTTGLGVVMVKSLEQTDPTHYVEQAKQCAAKQEWIQAKNYYLRAFSISKDPAYLVGAGRMLYEKGDEFSAQRYWSEAVTVDPGLIEAHEQIVDLRLQIARMYNSSAAWRRAKESAAALVKVDDQNAQGRFVLGLSEIRLADGQLDEAARTEMKRSGREHVRRAAELARENVEYALTLADEALVDGQTDECEQILRGLVEIHAEPGRSAAQVRYQLARFLTRQQRFEEALELYGAAESLSGDDPEVQAEAKSQHAQFWLTRWMQTVREKASTAVAHEYQEKARLLLEASTTIDPTSFLPYMLLAELYSSRGDHAEALQVCEMRIKRSIRREGMGVQQDKFNLYLLLLKAAEECLARLEQIGDEGTDHQALIAKAEAFAREAEAEFAERGPGLHMLGRIQLAKGAELAAIERFQKAATAYGAPNWRNSRLLAILLLRNGQPGAAQDAIRQALRDPTADAASWITQGEILLQTGEFDEAVRAADHAIRTFGESEQAIRVKATALARLGDMDYAGRLQDKLPGGPQDQLLKAEILYGEGKTEESLRIVRGLLAEASTEIQYLALAVRILVELDRAEEALSLLSDALAVDPKNYQLRLLQIDARKDSSQRDRQAARRQVFEEIEQPFERHYELAKWHEAHGTRAEAASHLAEAIRLIDSEEAGLSSGIRRRMLSDLIGQQFVHAIDAKDWEGAERIVERVVKENLDGADGMTYRGRLQWSQGSPELAITSLQSAIQKQPSHAATLALLGQCHMVLTPPRLLEAQDYFSRAVASDPNLAVGQKGLAILALETGDTRVYEAALAQCARLLPNDSWVRERLLIRKEQDEPLVVIAERSAIREQEPDNVDNLVRLAQLHARLERYDDAAECFEAALRSPQAGKTPLLAATSFFRGIGKPERALHILQELIDKAETDDERTDYTLLLADYWYELGDHERCQAELQKAAAWGETLKVCSAFAAFHSAQREFEAAAEWYGRAIELADNESAELGARYRKNLIDVHLQARQFDQAENAIQEYLREYRDASDGPLLRSALFTVRGDIDSAIDSLTEFLDRFPNHKHALFQRARLFSSQGQRGQAKADLERLRGMDPVYQNYQPRTLLADTYALMDRLDLAFGELESVIRDDPGAKDAALHLIRLYRDQDRLNDAERVCTQLTNANPTEPVWQKLRGEIRWKLGDRQGARQDQEAAAKISQHHPVYAAALLHVYGQANLPDRGIEYYEKTVPPNSRTPRVQLEYAKLLAMSGDKVRAAETFLVALSHAGFADLLFIREMAEAIVVSLGGEDAIELFREPPDKVELQRVSRHALAVLLTRYRRHSEALDALSSLLQSAEDASEQAMLLAAMGNMNEEQGNWQAAEEAYRRLLHIDDQNIIGMNNLAYILADKLGRPEDALAYAKRAAVHSNSPTVQDTLAWTLVLLGQYREAVAILTHVLEEHPTFITSIYHLADAHRRNGAFERADTVLRGAENLLEESVDAEIASLIRRCRSDIDQRKSD